VLIGDLLVNPVRPDDLDEQLFATAGCSANAMKALLQSAHPSLVAAALLPFVRDAGLHRLELTRAIIKAGAHSIRSEVIALYEGQDNVGTKRSSRKRTRRRK
jgi:hypothetical protein